jgi:NAD-dependent dihydropyrimidine dehydrogenase PreA subunit
MARRLIVKIDEELCNGCGQCVPACAEGALRIIGGKARLVSDALCDGLGACLGDCPEGAITLEDRGAEAFSEKAVATNEATNEAGKAPAALGCPGSGVISLPMSGAGVAAMSPGGTAAGGPVRSVSPPPAPGAAGSAIRGAAPDGKASSGPPLASALRHWPVQLHLLPPQAPFLRGAHLLLAADCTAFAVGDFHARYLEGRALAIACPKLDHGREDYLQKLVAMIDGAGIMSLTVLVMQVPCCGGLMALAREALTRATRQVELRTVVVDLQGRAIA